MISRVRLLNSHRSAPNWARVSPRLHVVLAWFVALCAGVGQADVALGDVFLKIGWHALLSKYIMRSRYASCILLPWVPFLEGLVIQVIVLWKNVQSVPLSRHACRSKGRGVLKLQICSLAIPCVWLHGVAFILGHRPGKFITLSCRPRCNDFEQNIPH